VRVNMRERGDYENGRGRENGRRRREKLRNQPEVEFPIQAFVDFVSRSGAGSQTGGTLQLKTLFLHNISISSSSSRLILNKLHEVTHLILEDYDDELSDFISTIFDGIRAFKSGGPGAVMDVVLPRLEAVNIWRMAESEADGEREREREKQKVLEVLEKFVETIRCRWHPTPSPIQAKTTNWVGIAGIEEEIGDRGIASTKHERIVESLKEAKLVLKNLDRKMWKKSKHETLTAEELSMPWWRDLRILARAGLKLHLEDKEGVISLVE
jgi:hypothetical protein